MSYDVTALKEGIEKAHGNIDIFKEAIDRELQTIADYERMIKFLEEKEQNDNLRRPNSQS